ncbi:MAG: filamentous hemagglutinin N-terminal domain-containing protein [Simkaniaceae bacterium]|nr:filamentous hemagglutinin N-terminal domain-containing protein [Simkaniaceae bacterium]
MRIAIVSLIFFTLSLFAAPVVEVVNGSATIQKNGNLLSVENTHGTVLNWDDFSIPLDERVKFIQPSSTSWVLNKVTGTEISNIFGTLTSNGQVVLINPNGILFGENSSVEVGGLIASSLKDVLVEGKLSATNGAIALIGNNVKVSGEILSKVGKNAYIRSNSNPYGITVKKEAGRVYIASEELTDITKTGVITGENVCLLSDGITNFYGKAVVGEIEISGKEGFYHRGSIQRTGALTLEPESDITISNAPSYNYEFESGASSDFSNITISKLIEELEKGPVTITTCYLGEGGAGGSITIEDDVDHTFCSPFSLALQTAGEKGISINGSLTNSGSGSMDLSAPKITITGKLIGSDIKIQGDLTCPGEIYSQNLMIFSKDLSSISGKVMIDGGNLIWKTAGDIHLFGEMGHLGGGYFLIDGARDFFVKDTGHLFGTNRTSEMTFRDLYGSFYIDKGLVAPGSAQLTISGKKAAFSMDGGTVSSLAPIIMDLGRHLHLQNSSLGSQRELTFDLGTDLLLVGQSKISSPRGIHIHTNHDISLLGRSSISGRSISLNAGRVLSIYDQSSIFGNSGPLSISAVKHLIMEGSHSKIESGQVTIITGDTISLDEKSKISSTMGNLSLLTGYSICLDDSSYLSAKGGDIDLNILNGSLYLYGNSGIHSHSHQTKILTGNSVIMENFSHIKSIGEQGTTIVVDQLDNAGGIVLATNASINTGCSPLRIFTTKRSQNLIQGTLNGHRYSPCLHYLSTVCEKWGKNYPDPFFAAPFTVFHIENGLIHVGPNNFDQKTFSELLINYIGPYTAEMQRDLHPYDEYTSEEISFESNCLPYSIKRRKQRKE